MRSAGILLVEVYSSCLSAPIVQCFKHFCSSSQNVCNNPSHISVILQRFSATHIQNLADGTFTVMSFIFSVTESNICADSKGSSNTIKVGSLEKKHLSKRAGRLEGMASFQKLVTETSTHSLYGFGKQRSVILNEFLSWISHDILSPRNSRKQRQRHQVSLLDKYVKAQI